MPTGYTAILSEKEDMTLKEFALLCARNFGALVMMRDEPLDAPIPEKFEVEPYYKESYDKAVKEYEDFMALPDKQAWLEAEYGKMVESETEAAKEASIKKELLRRRYNAMLMKVMKWEAPTKEHENLREFMIKQLHDSIEWDCSEYKPHIPSKEEWCDIERHKAIFQRSVDMHRDSYEKAIERVASRNQWLKDLRDSLDKADEL